MMPNRYENPSAGTVTMLNKPMDADELIRLIERVTLNRA
jgi:hypothetical protein